MGLKDRGAMMGPLDSQARQVFRVFQELKDRLESLGTRDATVLRVNQADRAARAHRGPSVPPVDPAVRDQGVNREIRQDLSGVRRAILVNEAILDSPEAMVFLGIREKRECKDHRDLLEVPGRRAPRAPREMLESVRMGQTAIGEIRAIRDPLDSPGPPGPPDAPQRKWNEVQRGNRGKPG
jgi:hypothetical protein